MSGHSCGLDTAAFALGALEPAEADALRAHLEGCAVCRDELAAFMLVTEALPLAVTQLAAPAGLRRRLKAEVKAEVKADARTQRAGGAGHRSRRAEGRPGRRWTSLVAPRPAIGFACAAVIAVAGVLGSGALSGAPTARQYAAAVYAPQGAASVRISGGHAELVVHHLQAPMPGHVYEVWLQRGAHGAPEPTRALFTAVDGTIAVPGDIAHLRRVLVTQEPAGGTAVPTTSPVIVASL